MLSLCSGCGGGAGWGGWGAFTYRGNVIQAFRSREKGVG